MTARGRHAERVTQTVGLASIAPRLPTRPRAAHAADHEAARPCPELHFVLELRPLQQELQSSAQVSVVNAN